MSRDLYDHEHACPTFYHARGTCDCPTVTTGQWIIESLCKFCTEVHLHKRSCCPFHFIGDDQPRELIETIYSHDGTAYESRELREMLTKQIAFGRSEPKSISGPLFDQPGLFD